MPIHANDLRRFVEAQAPVYATVTDELVAGLKRSHWMWFIFPQLAGLGHSATAQLYALSGKPEAQAYLAHPLLGLRLHECTRLMLAHADQKSAHDILASPDDLKFRSSMTLFAAISEKGSPFERALDVFYEGQPDGRTLALLDKD